MPLVVITQHDYKFKSNSNKILLHLFTGRKYESTCWKILNQMVLHLDCLKLPEGFSRWSPSPSFLFNLVAEALGVLLVKAKDTGMIGVFRQDEMGK